MEDLDGLRVGGDEVGYCCIEHVDAVLMLDDFPERASLRKRKVVEFDRLYVTQLIEGAVL